MKRCPSCNRTYTDASLNFCLEDGTPLTPDAPPPADPNATMNLEQGALAKALDNFTLSLKNDPRHVEAHYNLANLYYDAGDLQLAKLHYEMAAQIEPGFSLVYFNLSLVYHKLGDLNGALTALERYRQLEPEDEDIEVLNQLLKAIQNAIKK